MFWHGPGVSSRIQSGRRQTSKLDQGRGSQAVRCSLKVYYIYAKLSLQFTPAEGIEPPNIRFAGEGIQPLCHTGIEEQPHKRSHNPGQENMQGVQKLLFLILLSGPDTTKKVGFFRY